MSEPTVAATATATAESSSTNTVSLEAFLSALFINSVLAGAFLLAFFILRPILPYVYSPKTSSKTTNLRIKLKKKKKDNTEKKAQVVIEEEKDRRWWWKIIGGRDFWFVDDEELLSRAGLKGFALYAICRLWFKLFAGLALLAVIVLVPINVTGVVDLKKLDQLTMGNINDDGRYSGHIVMIYILDLFVIYSILKLLELSKRIRHQNLISVALAARAGSSAERHMRHLCQRTILVKDIPNYALDEDRLAQLFSAVGRVEKVIVVRKDAAIEKAVNEAEKIRGDIELASMLYLYSMIKEAKKLNEREEKRASEVSIGRAGSMEAVGERTAMNMPRQSSMSASDMEAGRGNPEGGLIELENIVTPPNAVLSNKKRRSTRRYRFSYESNQEDADALPKRSGEKEEPPAVPPPSLTIRASHRAARPTKKAGCFTPQKIDLLSDAVSRYRALHRKIMSMRSAFFRTVTTEDDAWRRAVLEQINNSPSRFPRAGMTIPEKMTADHTAFVVFQTPVEAAHALNAVVLDHPAYMMERHLVLDQSNIVWSTLGYDRTYRNLMSVAGWVGSLAMTVFWGAIMAFVTGLTKLSTIAQLFPELAKLLELNNLVKGIITGYLPPVIVSVMVSLVPTIFRYVARVEGKVTIAEIEAIVLQRHYIFQVFTVLLVTTVAQSAVASIKAIAEKPFDSFNIFATNVPPASSFFINYVLLQALTGPSGALLQISSLVIRTLRLMGLFTGKTPRTKRAILSPVQWDFAAIMATHSLIATIGIVYATLAPLLLVFVAFYFGFWALAVFYLIQHVYETGTDATIGAVEGLYTVAMQQFAALYMAQVTLTGIFFLRGAEGHGIAMIVLIVFTVSMHIHCSKFKRLLFGLPAETAMDVAYVTSTSVRESNGSLLRRRKGLIQGLISDVGGLATDVVGVGKEMTKSVVGISDGLANAAGAGNIVKGAKGAMQRAKSRRRPYRSADSVLSSPTDDVGGSGMTIDTSVSVSRWSLSDAGGGDRSSSPEPMSPASIWSISSSSAAIRDEKYYEPLIQPALRKSALTAVWLPKHDPLLAVQRIILPQLLGTSDFEVVYEDEEDDKSGFATAESGPDRQANIDGIPTGMESEATGMSGEENRSKRSKGKAAKRKRKRKARATRKGVVVAYDKPEGEDDFFDAEENGSRTGIPSPGLGREQDTNLNPISVWMVDAVVNSKGGLKLCDGMLYME
ncbi:hypothetical protein BJ742DRAFT_847029 [Cladochytrium replicatum]|nr:hypothetical protein BJ742DRAFT_847029 [Cladochytrium replicatum]